MITILRADARSIPLADESVDCVVTSPPYWGLRDYGVEGQLGLERLHDCLGWARGSECQDCHVCAMRRVFREVHRVLKPTGTLWMNYGDCYASGGKNRTPEQATKRTRLQGGLATQCASLRQQRKIVPGLKAKDLAGMAWRVAFALQADGWYLRNDIIWSKPSVMPESCRDRATRSHEYLFLLTKRATYFFDQAAWSEPVSENTHARVAQDVAGQAGSARAHAGTKPNGPMKAVVKHPSGWAKGSQPHGVKEFNLPGVHPKSVRDAERAFGAKRATAPRPRQNPSFSASVVKIVAQRNRRTVWTIPTTPTSEAHFATFPEALVEPCILAGCPKGGLVLDPFCGSGTTLVVANRLGCSGFGLELNPEYIEIARRRVFADVTPSREEIASGQKLLLEAL